MIKRIIAIAISAMLLLAGCKAAVTQQEPTPEPVQATPAPTADLPDSSFDLIGMIINDDGSDAAYMTMYGFLHTAETLGIAAKLYRASSPALASDAARQALDEGVDALVVFSPTGAFDEALSIAATNGIFTAVPFYETASQDVKCNVVADNADYYDELARGLAQRMTDRSLKSGRILVYGRDTATCKTMFEQSLAASYPQFLVAEFTRTAQDEQAAIDELAQFILYNRDIKGLYVIDADSSSIAVKARSQAQKVFKSKGAPSPTPTPQETPASTMQPNATEYTPNPSILKQISITVFCNGLSDDNYGLFEDNDIYALLIEPYYEAAAQSVMAADRALRNESTAASYKVNRPLIYSDTAEKYKLIYDQMKLMFSLEG